MEAEVERLEELEVVDNYRKKKKSTRFLDTAGQLPHDLAVGVTAYTRPAQAQTRQHPSMEGLCK